MQESGYLYPATCIRMYVAYIMQEANATGKPTLEDLRKRAKKSRATVAREVGVSGERIIYSWEREGVEPAPGHIVGLAKSLNAPLRDVFEAMGFDLTGVPTEQQQSA
jgi:DNA-binding XRE family transcriptional regulator